MQLVPILPTGLFPFALASKACLGSLSWGIWLAWRPNHLSGDLSVHKSNGSMLRNFRISELQTLQNNSTSSILRRYLVSNACTCNRTLSVITQNSKNKWELGQKFFENWKICPFFTILMTTKECKERITARVLPIRVSSSSSCIPSLVNANPRCINSFTCFSVTPFTCTKH